MSVIKYWDDVAQEWKITSVGIPGYTGSQGAIGYTGSVSINTSTVLQTTSYQIALTDVGTLQKCLSASTITIIIPLNSTVAFAVNTEISFIRYGAGAVTFSPASSVTLYSSDSKKSIYKQYEVVTLKQIATDEWVLIGSLSA